MKPKALRALWGLKWNPFTPEVPTEALLLSARAESFLSRIEGLVEDGGFALVSGDPGTGKSVILRIIAERVESLREARLGVITRPQSRVSDFYRELGDAFQVAIRSSNRWGGFKDLREKWRSHLASSLYRPTLLVDEAQEMAPEVLSELRILSSTDFDSNSLLTVVLAGDERLNALFRRPDLLPLGSRIRTRLELEGLTGDESRALLRHALERAGNPELLTDGLIDTLADHSAGNCRILMNLAGEVLAHGAQTKAAQLDEKLFLEVFKSEEKARRPRRRS